MVPENNPLQSTTQTPNPSNLQEEIAQPAKKKHRLFWILIVLFFTFVIPVVPAIIFLFVYMLIARPFQISGNAMLPHFVAGQGYITSRLPYTFAAPARGDVIVFKAPTAPDKDFIKRIIGLPNDTVLFQNGEIFINNQPFEETSYLNTATRTYGGSFLKEGQQKTVPAGNYFVLGDNRPYSSDSREWGFVPKKDIIGKIILCYSLCELSKK